MVKRLFLWILISLSVSHNLSPFVGSTQGMAILSEYGEFENIQETLRSKRTLDQMQPAGLGAASNLLFNALYQDCMVLIPAGLWQNIVNHQILFNDALQMHPVRLFKKYGNTNYLPSLKSIEQFKAQCIYASKITQIINKHLQKATTADQLVLLIQQSLSTIEKPTSLKRAKWSTWLELSQYLMTELLPLDNYMMKEIEADGCIFYLFIPKKICKKNPDIGLHINELTTVSNPWNIKGDQQFEFTRYQRSLKKALQQIIIKKREDAQQKWTFYIMGHGCFSQKAKILLLKDAQKLTKLESDFSVTTDYNKKHQLRSRITSLSKRINHLKDGNRVCGIHIEDFQDIILFLNNDVQTGLLYFSSCSAGGQQFIDAFSRDGKQFNLSYPVFADALVEAPSLNACPMLHLKNVESPKSSLYTSINWQNKCIEVDAPYDFKAFFDRAKSADKNTDCLNELIHALCPAHALIKQKQKKIKKMDIINLPSIRISGADYFAPIDSVNTFFVVKTHDPIEVPSSAQVLLLYCNNIDTITSKKKQFPFVVSMIPGSAAHSIETIRTEKSEFTDVIESFFSCSMLETSKLIYVKKIICHDDLFSNEVQSFHDVYIFNAIKLHPTAKESERWNGCLFKYKNRWHSLVWNYKEQMPDNIVDHIEQEAAASSQELIETIEASFENANEHAPFVQCRKATICLEDICAHC